ncbi:MAG: hypothetical protein ACI4UM_01630 [Succinivibrio sp.]
MSDEKEVAETKEIGLKLSGTLGSLAAQIVLGAASSIAFAILKSACVTNRQSSSVIGDSSLKPTNDETTLEESRKGASKTDATLAQDEVAGQKGKVDAAETNAKASTSDATASESGAQALKTKAGACDIQTKGMKLN